jgi:hypothetical protein
MILPPSVQQRADVLSTSLFLQGAWRLVVHPAACFEASLRLPCDQGVLSFMRPSILRERPLMHRRCKYFWSFEGLLKEMSSGQRSVLVSLGLSVRLESLVCLLLRKRATGGKPMPDHRIRGQRLCSFCSLCRASVESFGSRRLIPFLVHSEDIAGGSALTVEVRRVLFCVLS